MGSGGLTYLKRTKTTHSSVGPNATVVNGVCPNNRYLLIYVHLINIVYYGSPEFPAGVLEVKINTPNGSAMTYISIGSYGENDWRSGVMPVSPGEAYSVTVTHNGLGVESMAVYIEEFAAINF